MSKFDKNKLSLVKKSKVRTSNLHCQYVEPVYYSDGWKDSMLVSNSPHVKLIKLYSQKGGHPKDYMESDYVQMMLYWKKLGFYNRTVRFIHSKIQRMFDLFNSMQKHGYDNSKPIQILEQPFWKTRYGSKAEFLNGPEIWHGHHRAACAYVLGIQKIPCDIFRDNAPGSKKSEYMDRKLKEVQWTDKK